jgi:hypothetical protein
VLDQWLQSEERASSTFAHFDVIDLTEREAPSAEIKEHLCDLLLESAVDLAFLEDVTRRLGWARAESIVRQRLPANAKARRGRFGEVVGVFMLHQFEAYAVPIEKAHFAITGGQSQPSTDAVLLRIADGAVAEVCFVESKLRTRAENFAGVEGARQLKADHEKDVPDMLAFTAARLFDKADPLYDPFMNYMASRDDEGDKDSFRLLLFYDAEAWSERCLANLEDDEPELSPLRVHALRVSALRDLVDDIFGQVGMEVVDDEPCNP